MEGRDRAKCLHDFACFLPRTAGAPESAAVAARALGSASRIARWRSTCLTVANPADLRISSNACAWRELCCRTSSDNKWNPNTSTCRVRSRNNPPPRATRDCFKSSAIVFKSRINSSGVAYRLHSSAARRGSTRELSSSDDPTSAAARGDVPAFAAIRLRSNRFDQVGQQFRRARTRTNASPGRKKGPKLSRRPNSATCFK